MSNDKDTAAPYYYEPSVIVHDMYQVRDAQGHPVANLCTEEEAKGRVRVLNAAFQAGQKSVIPSDPRGLSDEEIERLAKDVFPPDEMNDGCPWYGHRRSIEDGAARQMMRYLRDKGYLSPSKDREIIKGLVEAAGALSQHACHRNWCKGMMPNSKEGCDCTYAKARALFDTALTAARDHLLTHWPMNPLLDKLIELRDEFELLNTMADAERLSKTKEARDCTDEQATRTGDTLNQCIALAQAQGEQRGEWMSVELKPPSGKVLLAGPAYNDPRNKDYWQRTGYYANGVLYQDDEFEAWEGYPPTHYMPLPNDPPPSTTGS